VINFRGSSAILLSLLLAFVLASIPLPSLISHYRPLWVPLVLLYWCLATPTQVGVGVAWTCGLISDALHGGLLGQHALSYLPLAYISVILHKQIRTYPLIQQSGYVLLALAVQQVILYWINGILGNTTYDTVSYWWPTLTSSLLWPPLFLFMRGWRRLATLR